ncbi:hypothetical protein VTG60DRAFT_2349 [Thermothelomyces hinnuleus]
MPPSSSLQYANTSLSLLFGRDQCSDVFGSDASNEICSPSRTLCCVRRGQEYPACHQSLGKGWCCIGKCGFCRPQLNIFCPLIFKARDGIAYIP